MPILSSDLSEDIQNLARLLIYKLDNLYILVNNAAQEVILPFEKLDLDVKIIIGAHSPRVASIDDLRKSLALSPVNKKKKANP